MERNLTARALLAAAVAIGSLSVCDDARADTPRYSYGELSYGVFDIPNDPEFDEGSSAGFAISYGFDNFQVFGRWRESSLDFSLDDVASTDAIATESVDVTEWIVGGGWHGLIGEPADLVVDFGFLSTSVDGTIFPEAKSRLGGYFAGLGLRWRIVKVFEVNGFVTYADVDLPLGSSWLFEVNALGYVGRVVLGIGYERRSWNEEDLADWRVGTFFVRYNFGQN